MQDNINLDIFDSYFDQHVSQPSRKLVGQSLTQEEEAANVRAEPISRALCSRVDDLVQDLENILDVCDIHVDESVVQQIQTLSKQTLYTALPVVSPLSVYRSLYDVRQCYELYLQLECQRLLASQKLFPEACKAESRGLLRRPKALYPLLQSWQAEAAPKNNAIDNSFFMGYAEAAYLGLGLNLGLGPGKQEFQGAVQLRNAHPLQAIVSLMEKHPQLLLLLGQRLPSVTQRLGLYRGYVKQLSLRLCGACRETKQNIGHADKSAFQLPPDSLLETAFPRAVFSGVLKSLITHEGPLENWPPQYFYQPASGQVKQLFLADFLKAVAWDEQALGWARAVLMDAVQQLQGEKTFDLFRLACNGSTDASTYLGPLTVIFLRRVQAGLAQLPDILKSVLTTAHLALQNLFGNVAERIFQGAGESQLAKALKARFHYLADTVDYQDREASASRAQEVTYRAFQQFSVSFLVGTVVHTALTNPIASGLLSPEQAGETDGVVFLGNLAFVADLIVSSLSCCLVEQDGETGMEPASPLGYQFSLFTRQSASQETAEFFENAPQYRRNLAVQVQQIMTHTQQPADALLADMTPSRLCYQLTQDQIRCIVQPSTQNTREVTGGFWLGTAGYFQWLARTFLEHCDYLLQNAEVLKRNSEDVLQQVIEFSVSSQQRNADGNATEDRFWVEHQAIFSNDVCFTLYDSLVEDIHKARRLTTEDALQKFAKLAVNEPVCFVPYFPEISETLQQYQRIEPRSAYLTQYERLWKQAQAEAEAAFTAQSATQQGLQLSEDTRDYLDNCAQVAQLFTLLTRLKKARAHIQTLESHDEEEYFQAISKAQAELGSLEKEAKEAISQISRHTDLIQRKKEEKLALEHLSGVIKAACEALSQGKPVKQPEPYDSTQAPFSLFEELETELRRNKAKGELEELLFNHNKRVQALYGGQRKFVPAGTLERLFQRQIAFPAPGSVILNKLFGGPSGIVFSDSYLSRE